MEPYLIIINILINILRAFIPVIFVGCILYHVLISKNKKTNEFKIFADRLYFKIFVRNPENDRIYHGFISGKDLVPFVHRLDLGTFQGTRFLNDMINTYRKYHYTGPLMIPRKNYYGLCTLLILNYDRIKLHILDHAFLAQSIPYFLQLKNFCDDSTLKRILHKQQFIFSRYNYIVDCSSLELKQLVNFMNLYLLYLLSLERPQIGKNLDARDYYDFTNAPK